MWSSVLVLALFGVIIGLITPFCLGIMIFISLVLYCFYLYFAVNQLDHTPAGSLVILYVILPFLGGIIFGDVISVMLLSEFWLHFWGIIKLFGQV